MTVEEITNLINGAAQNADPLGATVKFDFGDEGVIHIDGTGEKAVVTNDNSEADCVLIMKTATYEKLQSGDLNAMMAVMSGKIKIKGDMGVAMKLQSYM